MSAGGGAARQQGGGKSLGGSSKTCFKCGKPGHWSRDCTAPREEWIPSTYKPPTGDAAAAAGAGGGRQGGSAGARPLQQQSIRLDVPSDGEQPAAGQPEADALPKKTVKRVKKRQLSVLELTGPLGLAHVYKTFPAELRKGFKGRGHEASDLKRLLDLYRGWHRRLFPDVPFEVFIEKLEGLGSTRPVQACLRTMRSREVHGVRFEEDIGRAEGEEGDGGGFAGWAADAARGMEDQEAAQQRVPQAMTEDERLIALALEREEEDDEYLDMLQD